MRKIIAVLMCVVLLSAAISCAAPEEAHFEHSGDNIEQILSSVIREIPADIFAGAYIDSSGGVIVNLARGNNAGTGAELNLAALDNVTVNWVTYSLNELEAMKTALEPYMEEYGIATLDANEVTNSIDIELFEENERIRVLISSLDAIDSDIVNITVLEGRIIAA